MNKLAKFLFTKLYWTASIATGSFFLGIYIGMPVKFFKIGYGLW
jgi:hypothetical protein